MSLRGEAGWNAAYQKAFGKDRWKGLYKALRSKVTHVAFLNPFLPQEALARTSEEQRLQPHPSIPLAYERRPGEEAGDDDKLRLEDDGRADDVGAAAEAALDRSLPLYFLDGASVIAALALGAEPGQSVLDLCAAPGGKSVVLASLLFAEDAAAAAASASSPPGGASGTAADAAAAAAAAAAASARAAGAGGLLVCNDASRGRAARLRRVLESWVPPEMMEPGGRVVVVNVNAAAASSGAMPAPLLRFGAFDRVLVDAPCSSDRHLAHQGKVSLSHWASGVVKSNAERQLEILLCAATLVKVGGRILYCTCALAEQENDGVVAKFLKKAGRGFESEPMFSDGDAGEGGDGEGGETGVAEEAAPAPGPGGGALRWRGGDAALEALLRPVAERTAAGALILPDRAAYGPMYIARLRRIA